MIGVGTSLLFGRRAGKGGSPIPPFNDAMVDAWFMSGPSNSDKPSSITGVKGNVMALKNFAYALNSGFGKYEVDFTKYTGSNTSRNSISIHKEAGIDKGYATIAYSALTTSNIPSYSIEIKGLASGQVLYYYRNNEGLEKNVSYNRDGIYKTPMCYKEGTQGISMGFTINTVDEITITQLPSAYEGALVFDGVDDYGICNNLPILDDYTVICRRVLENNTKNVVASKSVVAGNGAFIFEYGNNATYSFSEYTSGLAVNLKDSVSYQTKNSYNGSTITVGNADDTDTLTLGIIREGDSRLLEGAIYYFALYNKSLTIEEIETEKERLNEEWLKRSKVTIPEPDVYYDLSLKDNSSPTRNIMDDLSGNGHDAEIFNAVYTESSGYRSDGAFVFDGVDDYAIMKNVKKGFKTVFMEVIPSLTKERGGFIYDQRVGHTSFGINIFTNDIAYNSYNWDGVTYINGKLNTTIKGSEVYLKHQVITIVNGTDLEPQKVVIGGDIGLAGYFSKMALYKLIGFYDELTSLQIEKVINYYKLKYD